MQLLHNTTPTALWHDIIHDAMRMCDIHLHEDLASYLVFLMVRYTDRPDIAKSILALDFLSGLDANSRERQRALQEVGDKCLIFSGLFPTLAETKLVRASYFVNLGRSSYANISTDNDIYEALAEKFVVMMDVLQSIRSYSDEFPDLTPLQAFDLWNDTGSKRALSVLKKHTDGTPIMFQIDEK